jgi:putative flippase GtrA
MRICIPANQLQNQLLRYFLVGGIAFIADISMLYLLTEFAGCYYLVAAGFAFLLGLTINYLLSVYWVFDYRAVSNRMLEFLIFTAIGLVGLVMNEAILYVLTEKLAVYYVFSKVFSTLVIFIFNFGMRKIMLFSRQRALSPVIIPVLTK